MKLCASCKEASRHHLSYCRDCWNRKGRERQHALRAKVDAIKLERGCVDCGYRVHACALHFDHRPGFVKSFAIATGVNRLKSWPVILAEMEKCEVRCANCHAVKTACRAKALRVTHDAFDQAIRATCTPEQIRAIGESVANNPVMAGLMGRVQQAIPVASNGHG